jgi:hypothetical protein
MAYGRNIFDPSVEPYAFNYADNVYQAFIGTYLLQFDGKKSVALYDFKNDKGLKTNLVNERLDIVTAMEAKLKAFIQQYNNRMVDDNLTLEGPQSGPNRVGK